MEAPFASKKEIEELMDLIGKRMAQIRNELKLSQYDVAEQVGSSQNPIYRLENGLKGTSYSLLAVLALYIEKFDVNPSWLFTKDNSRLHMFTNRKRNELEETVHKILTEFYKDVGGDPKS